MLKNKFGMTKVLVLVLSVLMLVSLAACNKKDAIDPDAMNSAIQSAIDAANAAQAEKDAALASSIAADKAAQAERDAAIASSIAADKAAQEEELKKAQEQAAAASKAAAEASKQAAEASKQAAEASKEASKANTTVKTTKGDTTTAPIVIEDKTDVLEAYSKLKTEYTFTKRDYYLAADYSELVLLFDKASVDLNNALTLDAAKAVLETLKVDVAAIENAETAAKAVQALIADLGDIETEVFTTQAEKIVEAREAYVAMKVAYADYFKYDVKEEADYIVDVKNKDGEVIKTVNETVALAEELGVEVAELELAEVKLDVLEAYIVQLLQKDMAIINEADPKHRFEADDVAFEALHDVIEDAHYKYLVLSTINGADVSAADLAIDWEYKLDKEGKVEKDEEGNKIYDKKQPIAWFTVEELIDVYVLPTLDADFAAEVARILGLFNTATKDAQGLYAELTAVADANKPAFDDIEDEFEDIYDALVDELEALSFAADYKGNATMDDAFADVYTTAINSYLDALNVYLTAAKAAAIEKLELATENEIEGKGGYLEQIEAYEEDLADDDITTARVERLNAQIANLNAKIDKANADLEASKANINAATLLTYDELLNEELAESKDFTWTDISDFEKSTDKGIKDLLQDVLEVTIKKNFVVKISVESDDETVTELLTLIEKTTDDLWDLRVRVSPFEEDAYDTQKETGADIFYYLKGETLDYVGEYYFENTEKFEQIVAIIDAAIAEIEATTAEGEATPVQVVSAKDKGKKMFFRNAAAKTYAEEKELTFAAIVKDTTLWTDSDTGLPVQYSYTAAEQAAAAIADKYVQVFKDVDAELVALDKAVKGDDYKVTTAKKALKSDEYKAILSTVAGTLKNEVEAVVTAYESKIDAAVAFAKNTDVAATALVEKLDYNHSDFVNIKVKETTELKYADNYTYTGYYDDIDTEGENFKKAFFASEADLYYYTNGKDGTLDDKDTYIDEGAALDYSYSKVVLLWNLKLEAAEEIKTEMAKYKNGFEANIDAGAATGTYTLTANEAGLYYYDGVDSNNPTNDEVVAKSAAAIAYEAELDTLLKDYTDKIMGLKASDVSNSIGKAIEKIDSYKTELFGTYKLVEGTNYQNYVVTANNNSDMSVMYYRANSKIFTAYNTYILENTYGQTRVPVKVNVKVNASGTDVNDTVTVSNAYYLDFFAINAGTATSYNKDGSVKTYGTVVKDIVVKKWIDADKDGIRDDSEALQDVIVKDGKYFADELNAIYEVTVTVERSTETNDKPAVELKLDGEKSHAKAFVAESNAGKFVGDTYTFVVVVEDGYKIDTIAGATKGETDDDATTYTIKLVGNKKNTITIKIVKDN